VCVRVCVCASVLRMLWISTWCWNMLFEISRFAISRCKQPVLEFMHILLK